MEYAETSPVLRTCLRLQHHGECRRKGDWCYAAAERGRALCSRMEQRTGLKAALPGLPLTYMALQALLLRLCKPLPVHPSNMDNITFYQPRQPSLNVHQRVEAVWRVPPFVEDTLTAVDAPQQEKLQVTTIHLRKTPILGLTVARQRDHARQPR